MPTLPIDAQNRALTQLLQRHPLSLPAIIAAQQQAQNQGLGGLLDTASMVAPSPAGDVLGLLSDARMFAQDPSTRTPSNLGLSLLGLLPFVPGVGMTRRVAAMLPAIKVKSTGKIYTGGPIHAMVRQRAIAAGEDIGDLIDGFTDSEGVFLDRKRAFEVISKDLRIPTKSKDAAARRGELDTFEMFDAIEAEKRRQRQ